MAKKTRKRLMSEINVVPYIDVMLVLLVIFMITTPLLTQGVKVELPQASAKPVKPGKSKTVVVGVDPGGKYFLEYEGASAILDIDVLVARVAAIMRLYPKAQVLVKGDKNVPYGKVVTMMALLQRKAGVPNVGLLTMDTEKNR